MLRVMTLDKGSKRRLRRIRWTAAEKISAAALFVLLVGFCIAVALWSASNSLRAAEEHRLEVRR